MSLQDSANNIPTNKAYCGCTLQGGYRNAAGSRLFLKAANLEDDVTFMMWVDWRVGVVLKSDIKNDEAGHFFLPY